MTTIVDTRVHVERNAMATAVHHGHDLHPFVPDRWLPSRSHTACKACGRKVDVEAVNGATGTALTQPCNPRV